MRSIRHRRAPFHALAASLIALGAAFPVDAQCGVPGSGSCVVPHTGTGCSDSSCCTTVCNVDPFCCDVGWDEYCAGEAVELCGLTPPTLAVMAFGVSTTLPGNVAIGPCDLAAYNTATGAWSIYFDGDDVGLTGKIIRAATITDAGDLVFSMDAAGTIAGLAGGPAGNAFEPYDLVRFTPTSLGDATAGAWTFHFDGSDVGLTGSLDRSFRGLSILPNGSIIMTTRGNATLPGPGAFTPNDLVRFNPTSLGAVTAGTWVMHFDGSDVGLTTTNERLDSSFVRSDGSIVLSTRGAFGVAGLTGGRADLVRFVPTQVGDNTAGTFSMVVSGTTMGLASDLNPQASFETPVVYPDGPRPGGGGGGGGGSEGPTSCGDAGTADCCVTSETPYCADSTCCEAVCAVDPLCCAVAWDEYCVGAATGLCPSCMPSPRAVMAFGVATSLPGGVSVSGCDLAAYDLTSGQWSTWFDGDDVGLGGRIIRAATVRADGDLLVSMDASGTLAGLAGGPNGTAYEMYDVLRFTPTSLGDTTAGTWTFHFDGSDVGFSGNADMSPRGLSSLADGSLVFSTKGDVTVPGVGPITACDLVKFTPTSLGATTAGTWSMYLDGSDVALVATLERFDAAFVTPEGRIMLSTRGTFDVPGLAGGKGDLFDFIPTSLGADTAGSFAMRRSATQMGLPSTANPQAAFIHTPTIDLDERPMLPVLFDRLPSGTLSDAAVDGGHAEYIIVYQGVDPDAGSTGLINAQSVIDAIRAEHGDNPSGYGILDFENPFITRLEAGPDDPNWQMTVDTVVAALQAVKAEFPQVKWTMYSMPLVRYWIDYTWSWADVPALQRESRIHTILTGFGPVLRECDWLNPSAYDRYELATYATGQQAAKTAQEVAWREAMVEVCNRFNETSGLPRKPIIPMVSPMFWKVGQISYNMKMISTEEILRDTVRPLMNEGADGIAVWTGLSYWVRAATSAQDLGEGQIDARYAFTMDFYGGTAPADWTAPAVKADLEQRISEHIMMQLDEARLEIYGILFGGP